MPNTTFWKPNATTFTIDPFQKFVSSLMIYTLPVIVLSGIAGNGLSLVVFMSKKLRKHSSSIYLSATAISDSVFLLSLFVMWLSFVKIDLIHTTGWCQSLIFVSYLCSFLSVWFIVCITMENFLLCHHPKRAIRLCTVRHGVYIVLTLLGFGVLLYSFSFWTSGVRTYRGKMRCTFLNEYVHFTKTATYFDSLISLVLPYGMISYMLTAMVVNTFQRRSASVKICLMSVIKMLTALSGCYLLLTLPIHVIRLRHLIMNVTSQRVSRIELIVQQFLQTLYYSSFSCKVMIHIFFGKNFRKRLSAIVWRKATRQSVDV